MILKAGRPPSTCEHAWGLCCSCTLPAAKRVKWAWLADTHISADAKAERGGWRPAARLERIATEIAATDPSGVLVNGDLAWSRGELGDYRLLLSILSPVTAIAPLVLGVGNHDHRGNLLRALASRRGQDPAKVAMIVEQPPYRFILLDSQIHPHEIGGEIGIAQVDWLDDVLRTGTPLRTVLFVHHPGVSTSEGCRDFDSLTQVAVRHRSVQAIVTGHDHEFSLGRVRGVHWVGLPATGFPFTSGTPCGWIEADLSVGGLALHVHGSSGSSSHHLDWR